MIKNTLDIINSPRYELSKFTSKYKEQLEKDGFCVLPPDNSYWKWIGANPEKIRKIINSLLEKEGASAGSEGKEEFTIDKGKKIEQGALRLGNLLNKNEIFSKIATIPEIIQAAHSIIQNDIKLSSVLFRQPELNAEEQEIHMDWVPRWSQDENFNDIIAFLYLEDANKSNGATTVIPGTHKKLGYPCMHINQHLKHPNEFLIEAKKGSILILNALTWHKGGSNKSGKDRGIIVVDYRNRKLKQLLNLKMYIDEDKIKRFNDIEKYLFGLRENDSYQKEKSVGPGEQYKNWLKENPEFNHSK